MFSCYLKCHINDCIIPEHATTQDVSLYSYAVCTGWVSERKELFDVTTHTHIPAYSRRCTPDPQLGHAMQPARAPGGPFPTKGLSMPRWSRSGTSCCTSRYLVRKGYRCRHAARDSRNCQRVQQRATIAYHLKMLPVPRHRLT